MKLYDKIKMTNFVAKIVDLCNEENPKWGKIFENCFMDTLEKAVKPNEDGTVFMLTGDIPAMWLRDSVAQIRPYLVLANQDKDLLKMIQGLNRLQFRYINHDPYANAFNQFPNKNGHQNDDTEMSPWIWERKYEIDSLAYPLQLAYLIYKNTQATEHFDVEFYKAVDNILNLWIMEQNHIDSSYHFQRDTDRVEDTLANEGKGTPVGYTGMTWSGFRPSDDVCRYHYLVPSNMFATVVLDYLIDLNNNKVINLEEKTVDYIGKLSSDIKTGIKKYGVIDLDGTQVFAYEVDGLGNSYFTDDPNVPSLLSAPYLGYCANDNPLYIATRSAIFSHKNPYYYEGKCAKGLGSSHTYPNYIWPIALAMEGLTTDSKDEKRDLLNVLASTDGDTLHMHESFHVNNPNQYSREWFSWANMMFCELVLDYFGFHVKK